MDSSSSAATAATAAASPSPAAAPSKPVKPRFTFDSSDPLAIINSSQQAATAWQVGKHVKDASKNWDTFYKAHSKNDEGFFKDRHWTIREFEVLDRLSTAAENDETIIMEVGCGTGAFLWGLMEQCHSVRFHAFDFSKNGVTQVKENPKYDPSRINAFVHDLTSPTSSSVLQEHTSSPPADWRRSRASESSPSELPLNLNSPDIVSCIFVLSALPPDTQLLALRSLFSVIKPGGTLLLRDYALHDQTQLRFHSLPSAKYAAVPSLLSTSQPWYRRGDSTMCYFFKVEEIEKLVEEAAREEGWKVAGSATLIERDLENRKEGWKCGRRFVQGSWVVEKLETV